MRNKSLFLLIAVLALSSCNELLVYSDYRPIKEGEWENIFQSLDADGSPTAYIFKCIHCGKHGGYIDFD